jgi:hypothetical protein
MHKDTKALGFVILELIEQGSSYYKKLALEHLDKWFLQVGMFLELAALNLAKELLLVSYLNPQFLYLLIVLAYLLKAFTIKRGACEVSRLYLSILAHTILS